MKKCLKHKPNIKKISLLSAQVKAGAACPHCKGPQPLWTRSGLFLKRDFSGTPQNSFASDAELQFCTSATTTTDVYSILRNIPQEDEAYMGFCLPTRAFHMFFTALPVPPVIMRPSIASSESSRTKGHDDLTTKLQDICKANNLIGELQTANRPTERAVEQCMSHLYLYLTNDARAQVRLPTMGRAAARQANLRSVSTRLRGKKGRIRGNLCGKRVDFSARSVIGPDATIDVDEVGLPAHIAHHQTRPETVTQYNRKALQQMVRNGHGVAGGASFLTDRHGRRRALRQLDAAQRAVIAEEIDVGFTVDRHLRDGDYVLIVNEMQILCCHLLCSFQKQTNTT